MAKKIVTLYINDTSIRLLVTHGKRIKKWADSSLEPDLVKNAVVLKEAEVATKIRQLFKVLNVKAKKIIVGVSGLHCLTRPIILPQLPREMLDEAVRREAKRVLPVPPEQLYISWQTIPAPPGKTQVFLVAIPCKTADAMFKMLHQAGLKPYLVDLKPLALARVVRETTAVIVDVQPTEFDIVIIADGVCQPVRTLSLPSEAISWPEKLTLIRNDLNRTIEFYNSNNPERPLSSTVPVFASGELANETEICQSLSDELGHPVLPLASPLEYPTAGLDPSHYMVNMGLTLKELPPEKEAGPLAANVNALPTPYRPKPISLTNILAPPGAAIAIGLIFFLLMLIQSTSADIASTQGQLNATEQLLQQKLSQKQQLTNKITELQTKIAEAEESGNNFGAALGGIEKGSNEANSIEVAVNSFPSTMNLTSVSYAESTLTINGSSPSEEEVLSYLRDLDASGKFSEITIPSMRKTEGEEEGTDFTLVLKAGERD